MSPPRVERTVAAAAASSSGIELNEVKHDQLDAGSQAMGGVVASRTSKKPVSTAARQPGRIQNETPQLAGDGLLRLPGSTGLLQVPGSRSLSPHGSDVASRIPTHASSASTWRTFQRTVPFARKPLNVAQDLEAADSRSRAREDWKFQYLMTGPLRPVSQPARERFRAIQLALKDIEPERRMAAAEAFVDEYIATFIGPPEDYEKDARRIGIALASINLSIDVLSVLPSVVQANVPGPAGAVIGLLWSAANIGYVIPQGAMRIGNLGTFAAQLTLTHGTLDRNSQLVAKHNPRTHRQLDLEFKRTLRELQEGMHSDRLPMLRAAHLEAREALHTKRGFDGGYVEGRKNQTGVALSRLLAQFVVQFAPLLAVVATECNGKEVGIVALLVITAAARAAQIGFAAPRDESNMLRHIVRAQLSFGTFEQDDDIRETVRSAEKGRFWQATDRVKVELLHALADLSGQLGVHVDTVQAAEMAGAFDAEPLTPAETARLQAFRCRREGDPIDGCADAFEELERLEVLDMLQDSVDGDADDSARAKRLPATRSDMDRLMALIDSPGVTREAIMAAMKPLRPDTRLHERLRARYETRTGLAPADILDAPRDEMLEWAALEYRDPTPIGNLRRQVVDRLAKKAETSTMSLEEWKTLAVRPSSKRGSIAAPAAFDTAAPGDDLSGDAEMLEAERLIAVKREHESLTLHEFAMQHALLHKRTRAEAAAADGTPHVLTASLPEAGTVAASKLRETLAQVRGLRLDIEMAEIDWNNLGATATQSIDDLFLEDRGMLANMWKTFRARMQIPAFTGPPMMAIIGRNLFWLIGGPGFVATGQNMAGAIKRFRPVLGECVKGQGFSDLASKVNRIQLMISPVQVVAGTVGSLSGFFAIENAAQRRQMFDGSDFGTWDSLRRLMFTAVPLILYYRYLADWTPERAHPLKTASAESRKALDQSRLILAGMAQRVGETDGPPPLPVPTDVRPGAGMALSRLKAPEESPSGHLASDDWAANLEQAFTTAFRRHSTSMTAA